MGETTITRRDKVFWEKESQMRGRRAILGWHIWRFSFLLCALCIELKHCPFFFLIFNLHYQRQAKNKTWVKWQKRVDILSIDYNMFPSCVETISFWRKKSCKIWTFFLYTKDRKHFTAKRRFLRCQRNLGITGIFYHKTASSTTFFFIFSEA